MLNAIFVLVLERLVGRKFAVLLEESTGVSERTWRTRQADGWDPSEQEIAHLRARSVDLQVKRLVKSAGWLPGEARAIMDGQPSIKERAWLPTADLVYSFSPQHGAYCQETLSLARRFDVDSAALFKATTDGDLDQARAVLLSTLDWLLSFCPEEIDTDDARRWRAALCLAATMDALLAAADQLNEALVCHILSCWDLEFCAGYFGHAMQPYPLFEFVMPRFAPDIDIEPGTGRILRAGLPPARGVFEKSMLRLMDFLFVVVAWGRDARMPDSLPKIGDFVIWSGETERRLVSWRDETTRLTASQLGQMWNVGLGPDTKGEFLAVPWPMFVCAHLFSRLLAREDGRPVSLTESADTYRAWWQRNLARLTVNGLRFGAQAWPDYLTAQPPDATSFASFCSAQFVGRSSSPRDCQ